MVLGPAGQLAECRAKYYYYYYYLTNQHKAAGRKTRLDIQNYGCNGNLLCYHGVVERNRISSLQSHGKALEKECCLSDVFSDSGDSPANHLCELNGHLMLCTSCFCDLLLLSSVERAVCYKDDESPAE